MKNKYPRGRAGQKLVYIIKTQVQNWSVWRLEQDY